MLDAVDARRSKRQPGDIDALSSGGVGQPLGSSTNLLGSRPLFPAVPFAYLQTRSAIGYSNPRPQVIYTDFLLVFLAIPLYWCDALMSVRGQSGDVDIFTQMLAANDSTATKLKDFMIYLGIADPSTTSL